MKKLITVFRWIGAFVFFLMAFVALSNKGYLGALFFAIGGIIILPLNPIEQIRNKLKLKNLFTIILSVILFFVGIIVTPTSDVQTTPTNNITKTVDNVTVTDDLYETSESTEVTSSESSTIHETEATDNETSIEKAEASTGSTKKESKSSIKNEINSDSVQQTTNNTHNDNKNCQTVYITETGKKYHSRKSCPGLSNANSITETTLEIAENMGLTPCLKCH